MEKKTEGCQNCEKLSQELASLHKWIEEGSSTNPLVVEIANRRSGPVVDKLVARLTGIKDDA